MAEPMLAAYAKVEWIGSSNVITPELVNSGVEFGSEVGGCAFEFGIQLHRAAPSRIASARNLRDRVHFRMLPAQLKVKWSSSKFASAVERTRKPNRSGVADAFIRPQWHGF